ncbi:MAG: cation:proton antiporter regulatory subunit, partial [Gammaproteobacteria bacterium]
LYTVTLEPGAHAVNRSIGALDLKDNGVVVTALRRDGVVGRQPPKDTVLKARDVLVLWGTPEDLEISEALLLAGPKHKPEKITT